MLFLLGEYFTEYFGPFRLLTSHFFLAGMGLLIGGVLSFILLPRLAYLLPRDRGRAFAVDAKAAQGKPTGAGIIFVSIFFLLSLLLVPPSWNVYFILLLTFASCLFGYLDDRSTISWSEYKKGLIDLIIGVAAAMFICQMNDVSIWFPFTKAILVVPPIIFVPVASIFVWAAINTTNCTDGVDGLSGTLICIAFLALGSLLYFALGHQEVSKYLLLPHYKDGASWGIVTAIATGTLAGYLWYNAHPSVMLMGDAGSRAFGFLLGVLVIETGNPFLIFMVSGVLLINGGTGLLKVALLRFAKISIFKNVRFPLHDHVRHNRGWSATLVLVRFALVQAMLALVFMVLLIKLR